MPTFRYSIDRVKEVLGLSVAEAVKVLEKVKAEVEGVEEGYLVIELEVDRPDMYSLEGIKRQIDGLLGREVGIPKYTLTETGITIEASSVPPRPYVAGAVIWNVNVDEFFIEELIQFQEKLHNAIGKNRSRVAIGLHDLDKLPSREVRYTFDDIDKVRFTPLHYDKEMSLREVLENTQQGILYGNLSRVGNRHPVLYSGTEVISVPPVINSDITAIEPGTKNIFIDVTGTELKPVLDTLSVLAANLSERSSRVIGYVTVSSPEGNLKEPSMETRDIEIDASYISSILGRDYTLEEITRALERMRFNVKETQPSGVNVEIPRYRVDVLHQIDIVEEIVLFYGIENIGYTKPVLMLRGELTNYSYWERAARQVLTGLGFTEMLTYTLVSCTQQVQLSEVEERSLVKIKNPVSTETTCLRASLTPKLIEIAALNRQHTPLRLFELGEVVVVTGKGDRGVEGRRKLAILYMDDKAGYEDIQAVVYTLLETMGHSIEKIKPLVNTKIFIKGRVAFLQASHNVTAILGELHPEILEKVGIDYPIALAEIDYTDIVSRKHSLL